MSEEVKVRENFVLETQCLEKLDFIRNRLIPFYGEDTTLKEVENALWNQYFKFKENVSDVFKTLENETT